ncbi:DUF1365 domain-containing protein [Tritonibacter litoralis]
MEHIQGKTVHARRGDVHNSFTYGVDFVLCDLQDPRTPALLSRNRFNLWSVHNKNHGGPRGDGRGEVWFRELLAHQGLDPTGLTLLLLTQPSFLWFHFNPVSFWIALRDGQPCAFVAEVNSTFGQRHCYFCAHPDFRAIAPTDRLEAQKLMHVSPFQTVAGQYRFALDWGTQALRIRILYANKGEGVFASLAGQRNPARSSTLAWAAVRRPMGALRVLALIHWQALILWAKRAPFLNRQPAPPDLVSGSADPQQVGE